MTGLQILVVLFCGLLIGLAIYFLIRSLRRMAKGRCCEGCSGCPQAGQCSSRDNQGPPEQEAGKE